MAPSRFPSTNDVPDPVSVAPASETGEPLYESRKSAVSRPSTAREKVTGIEVALRPSVARTSVPNDAVGAVPADPTKMRAVRTSVPNAVVPPVDWLGFDRFAWLNPAKPVVWSQSRNVTVDSPVKPEFGVKPRRSVPRRSVTNVGDTVPPPHEFPPVFQ